MNESFVMLRGNVASDVTNGIAGETAWSRFRLAVNTRRLDKESNQWSDGPTSYVTVKAWRQTAENVAETVHKGDPLVVMGRLRVREWATDDKQGTAVEIEAVGLGHDLSRTSLARQRLASGAAA